MALTDAQIGEVWESQIGAEVRALYFADLTSGFTLQKQWVTGISFFFSSGAAVALIAKVNQPWIPLAMSLLVAIANAYSVAVGLDSKIRTMAKLQASWSQIASDYKMLWNHWYADNAESELADLQRRGAESSGLAATDAPNDSKRMLHWTDQVFKQHRLESA